MTATRLNLLLQGLGHSVGLPELGADENGYCRLTFDDRTVLHMQAKPKSDRLVLYSEVIDIGESHLERIRPLLLNWNLKPEKTCGGALGLSSGTVVLSVELDMKSMDSAMFQSFLDRLVGSVERLRESIQEEIAVQARAKEGIISHNPFLQGIPV